MQPSRIKQFQTTILTWWKNHRRELPWRKTHDPYKILVSEIMLQQTQVSRGLPKYIEFTNRFPTVESLAHASTGEILRMWKGMGYNRRALYLQNTAKKVVLEYNGKFPNTEQQLTAFPGLGTYTARAIMVFAFKIDIAMVDTNIRQIITHFFFDDIPQTEKVIQKFADQLVPKGKSWEWHQALMDYGALALERNRKRIVKKKSKPFKETNRYFRGRLLDLVYETQWKEADLTSEMVKKFGKDEEFIEQIIKGMSKDGLIVRSKTGIISLPE
ncbi:MAG: hypothetical protein WAV51_03460 [Microgenomates group bacterium]